MRPALENRRRELSIHMARLSSDSCSTNTVRGMAEVVPLPPIVREPIGPLELLNAGLCERSELAIRVEPRPNSRKEV